MATAARVALGTINFVTNRRCSCAEQLVYGSGSCILGPSCRYDPTWPGSVVQQLTAVFGSTNVDSHFLVNDFVATMILVIMRRTLCYTDMAHAHCIDQPQDPIRSNRPHRA